MYGSYYNQVNQQNEIDKINAQMANLERVKQQLQQPMPQQQLQPIINQTFQSSPNNNGIRFVNTIEDVKKELAIFDTPFIANDYSKLWIKNAKGEIRTFYLEEIIPKDDKDLLIEDLQKQINNLSNQIKEMNHSEQQYDEKSVTTIGKSESELFDEPITTKTTSNVSNVKTSKSRSK